MLSYNNGIVTKIIEEHDDVSWVEITYGEDRRKAINYNSLTGKINLDDRVVINTTAVDLSLGTGGQHFVMYNHSNSKQELSDGKGHIMKLRYTPNQFRCMAAEEEGSRYHEDIKNFESLDNHLVIVATLHSMLAPIAASIKKKNPELKINYIMTDGGALPISFSNNVRKLKDLGVINKTITIGDAFGGDLECVNLYTGLIASKEILKSDVTIVAMGPGIVGTGTKYGFTGVEQAGHIDIINKLGGRALAVPRISFADKRNRHLGISHHSLTILGELTNSKSIVVFPDLEDKEKNQLMKEQIRDNKLDQLHDIRFIKDNSIAEVLEYYNLNIKTMGRGIEEDPDFFKALGSVGRYVSELLGGGLRI